MSVTDRFLRYVAYPTQSSTESGTHPSTAGQIDLAARLAAELSELGLTVTGPDGHGYVYATLPASASGAPAVGLIAHMDTSPDASGENIAARVVKYTGEDIILNSERGIVLSAREYPALSGYLGQSLVVTDGTTLLGADDKAGIAEIMTALERIVGENVPHGKICVAFGS